ncbi:Stk1 family PASTA domain-containing Ser/Thr kinase [Paenibacillus sp. YN15]|uniref:Stk1 family PASTA domain-containing Ser/Thr kinase n=1 Tax=Paenibacillus sp. YN15 TaxID=1742774 RepID=UPI000DCCF734|nr:Stk1 family PASTA domain-containing Ser/Thr kinase [Paenibacillus sp. YN15]RAU92937.1 Stk1 family PASTA domain-containing Ser/Thr kinase [Paenibacillus sp. YN15]
MIGETLGGRYEILERVGGGGMALVYKAQDLLLNRYVAVKVLRQQYVHDEEFIRRFRREAQSAASLSHPNVVSMYDVGQEGDNHFIVMEYVEGMTLNDLIREKAPLQVEDALHIATQICDALEHAHHNQIIHRDIKPHNILIGKNGRIKVTDFGIARATTSSTITQTGSVVGSVHYFSPEHAKGISTGAKSDLYSLGIVLYQMLTGKLPFLGESPISVALKHLQENVEEPRKVNPLIPQSVENIILKAMRKNPDERYQSASDMLQDLETALDPKRRNEPKLTFLDDGLDVEATRVLPALRPGAGLEVEVRDGSEAEFRKKRNIWIAPLVWTGIFLVFLSVMWFWVIPGFKDKIIPKDVVVPQVVGKMQSEAESLLTQAGFQVVAEPQFSDKPVGQVFKRTPDGAKLKENTEITLLVSKGAEKQMMQSYKNRLFKDVKAELLAAGLQEDQILSDAVFSELPEDTIVNQEPAVGAEFDPVNGKVKFYYSKGRQTVIMPDLVNSTVAEAEAKLLSVGLKLAAGENGRENVESFDVPSGRVVDTHPYKTGDPVEPSMEIKLFVSSGPPKDAVTYTASKKLTAATSGKSSIFRIVISDAKFDNEDYNTMEVSGSEIINVKVTLTKEKSATILIYRDNVLWDSETINYQNYLDQKTKPSASPTPTAPSASPSAAASPTATHAAGSVKPSPKPSGG